MPTAKLKHPDKYPKSYHDALLRGVGTHFILTGLDKQECLLAAKKFRVFVKSIKEYPMHPSGQVLKICTTRTKIEETRTDDGGYYYQLFVVVEPMLNLKNKIINRQ